MQMTRRWMGTSVLALLLASPLAAALAPKLSTERMVHDADAIVVGHCEDMESRWLGSDLVTFAKVEVIEGLKGPDVEALTVILPGGVDTSGPVPLAMDFSGAPSLTMGGKDLLFLRAVPSMPGHYTVLGYSQGRYRVVEKPGAEPTVMRDLSGLTLLGEEGREAGRVTRETLGGLRAEIARILSQSPPGSGRIVQ